MKDSDINLESKIYNWLTKSGYPLELFSYESLRQYGYICEKSPLYTDIESKQEREIDISAEKTVGDSESHNLTVNLLVECKKSEKPIVVLSSGPDMNCVRREVFSARVCPSEFCNAQVLANIGFKLKVFSDDYSLPFSTKVHPGYSVLQAFKNSDELFHRTLYGLAKAEHYYEELHEKYFESSVKDKKASFLPVTLHLSLLVVDASLFNAYLDEGKLKVKKSNWASVTLNLPWTPRPESERRANIQIVTKDELVNFLKELDIFIGWINESGIISCYVNEENS